MSNLPPDIVVNIKGSDWPIRVNHLKDAVVLVRGPHKIAIPRDQLDSVAHAMGFWRIINE